jgi:nucleoside-diphosphate-sugar epimerase
MQDGRAEPRLFCFGLGYTGERLARAALERGWQVAGTCRTPAKAERLRDAGIKAVVFDGTQPVSAGALAGTTHLLCSVPPDAEGDPVLRQHQDLLAQRAPSLRWLGLLSTTGVYGDCEGAWIDETHVPNPLTEANQLRLEAEQAWQALGARLGQPVWVFRVAGIYGPDGRNVLETLAAGRARRVVKPGQFFNRIHVDDLVAVVLAAMRQPGPGTLLNVCDDLPAPAEAVLCHGAELLGIEPPPAEAWEAAALSPFARHFYAENRRLHNDRLKQVLGLSLQYPSYRDGLRALAAAHQASA